MKVFIGADHGGFELKEKLKVFVSNLGFDIEDLGAFRLNPEDDYPDFIIPTVRKVSQNPNSLGIVIGRSGNGEAIAANKVKGIRAAVCLTSEMARKAKKDNDANVLSLGADYIDGQTVQEVVKTFLETKFSDEERHLRRIEKIKALE